VLRIASSESFGAIADLTIFIAPWKRAGKRPKPDS
jgi:hypothetical protein